VDRRVLDCLRRVLLLALARRERACGATAKPAARNVDQHLEAHLLLAAVLLDPLNAEAQDARGGVDIARLW